MNFNKEVIMAAGMTFLNGVLFGSGLIVAATRPTIRSSALRLTTLLADLDNEPRCTLKPTQEVLV